MSRALEVLETLQGAGFPRVMPVRAIDEFERCTPLLVTEARKQFLRYGPVDPPAIHAPVQKGRSRQTAA